MVDFIQQTTLATHEAAVLSSSHAHQYERLYLLHQLHLESRQFVLSASERNQEEIPVKPHVAKDHGAYVNAVYVEESKS